MMRPGIAPDLGSQQEAANVSIHCPGANPALFAA
jgi:hypothetical protein